jgi:hypothetical protein
VVSDPVNVTLRSEYCKSDTFKQQYTFQLCTPISPGYTMVAKTHPHRYYGPQLQLVNLQERLRSLDEAGDSSSAGTQHAAAEIVTVRALHCALEMGTESSCAV